MDTQLFPLEESLSPRLKWMQKFRITVREAENQKWLAQSNTKWHYGPTEDDALVGLAKKMNILTWNEMLWKHGQI